MKGIKISLSILLLALFTSFVGSAQTNENHDTDTLPRVDKRIELLSIIFRLAGNVEYNHDDTSDYAKDIYKHFDKYINDPVIAFAKKLKESNNVCYDAVLAMALYISQPPQLNPLMPFNDSIPEPRWKAANANKFITLLQKFYIDAKCDEFFKQEESFYKAEEEKGRLKYAKLDEHWYKEYRRVPGNKFYIILGLGLGGNGYVPSVTLPGKKKDNYAIIDPSILDDK